VIDPVLDYEPVGSRTWIATPGHTPACASYEIGDAVFTGDALFMDDYGTGRCDFPKRSADAMYDSICRLYELPDETRVFVGHDYLPDGRELRWETTIGASKDHNPQLNASTTRAAFVSMRTQRDATLEAPRLLFQSVQTNIDGGRLPAAHPNGVRYFSLPVNFLRRADELYKSCRAEVRSTANAEHVHHIPRPIHSNHANPPESRTRR
jgi:hypothetical protein